MTTSVQKTSMGTNEFATMLHKSSHIIIVVLVYAVLEWILILLLLLNGIFSYFIDQFANHFGLKPPCIWCSRLNRALEPKGYTTAHNDHVCQAHGAEISKLGYCSTHGRLADQSKNLCADCCSSSRTSETMNEMASVVGFFTRVSHNILENDQIENHLKCCCCDEILNTINISPPSVLFKDSWDFLDYIQKKASPVEFISEENREESLDTTTTTTCPSKTVSLDQSNYEMKFEERMRDEGTSVHENELDSSDVSSDKEFEENFSTFKVWKSNQKDGIYRSIHDPFLSLLSTGNVELPYVTETMLQNQNYMDSDKFICIEIIDSDRMDNQKPLARGIQDINKEDEGNQMLLVEETQGLPGKYPLRAMTNSNRAKNGEYGLLESQDMYNDVDLALGKPASDSDNVEASQAEEQDKIPDSGQRGFNRAAKNRSKEAIPDNDVINRAVESSTRANVTDDFGTEVSEHHESNDQGETLEEVNQQSNLTMFGKGESGIEDSLDGSLISEVEIDNDSLTTDHLKAVLKAQQKALSTLYAELEEERKAAATAAQETMNMITKLQEEKSSMQMEAVQYQRMMEEQAEYDQEALQLLNDLMIKREKEKHELEKELEIYHKNILDYEAREQITAVRSKFGSFKSTNSSDSFDPNIEGDTERRIANGHQESICKSDSPEFIEELEETGVESIAHLNIPDISLAEFEEERICILQELQALEAKLFAEYRAEDFDVITYDSCNPKAKGTLDGFSVISKKLLPLFDATDSELNEGEFDKEEVSNHSTGTMNRCLNVFELEKNKVLVEEELENMHERLQALEADKEFLKHCMGSMMKGDNKGLLLLQEILEHLRDLRSVELSYNRCISITNQ